MTDYPVFFCEETDRVVFSLRVYEDGPCSAMSGGASYHNCISEKVGTLKSPPNKPTESVPSPDELRYDPRWPTVCTCGHVFSAKAQRQVWTDRVYRRSDTGAELEGTKTAPAGAVWNAWWFGERDHWSGQDGRSLICRLPDGGDWMIDGPASNCTMPDDSTHKCWVRHGSPEDGTLHVDKNGHTCAAGAGSIATPGYHGFLHQGRLTQC